MGFELHLVVQTRPSFESKLCFVGLVMICPECLKSFACVSGYSQSQN